MSHWSRILSSLLLLIACIEGASLSIIPHYQMRYDAMKSTITPTGDNEFLLKLFVEEDNQDTSLPLGFRRWWHVKVDGLNCQNGPCKISVEIHNGEYTDIILPVWSLDGITYDRCSTSVTYSAKVHRFALANIPMNVTYFHLAKFFPYPIPRFEAFRQEVLKSPMLKEEQIGASELGYPMYVWEIAKEGTLNQTGAPRIYVQAGIHPSETTSYFVNEGFLDWLLFSKAPEVDALLDQAIIDVVPMSNPDGVSLGNYRTNANSVNLEEEYGPPYDSSVKEAAAIRSLVERYMGTAENVGEHPILVLMNLHSTHGNYYPFHFLHQPYYDINGTGVIPEVRALEELWEKEFKYTSEFIDRGQAQYSTFSVRHYIEAMIHDRWTIDPKYTAPMTMAITMEGVYHLGPQGGCCNTIADYQQLGREMGLAMLEYLALLRKQ